jgi:serine/threonine protein phosphatase 1
MNKIFCIGDIHGSYKGMMQCFERAKFDYKKDTLICLGDVADGWGQVKECFDELLKIKKLIYVTGNHDCWFLEWSLLGIAQEIWVSQGGKATLKSYKYNRNNVSISHIKLLQDASYYYVLKNKDNKEILFVHGGINVNTKIERQDGFTIMWDRELMNSAYLKGNLRPNYRLQDKYKEIFIGHTTTHLYNSDIPLHCCEVWNLDTGGGWEGKITIMNIDTHEYWQSDNCYELYPEENGRR